MDSIGNFLTSVRNAKNSRKESIITNHSKIIEEICKLLKEIGAISSYKVDLNDGIKSTVVVIDNNSEMNHLRRISKPGRRIYVKSKEIKIPLSGIGNIIISTSSGLMEARKAKKLGLGGEIICEVW